jgi:hypothetical protein
MSSIESDLRLLQRIAMVMPEARVSALVTSRLHPASSTPSQHQELYL